MEHTDDARDCSYVAALCAVGAGVGYLGAETSAQIGILMTPGWVVNKALMLTAASGAVLIGSKAAYHVGAAAVFGSIASAAWLTGKIVR